VPSGSAVFSVDSTFTVHPGIAEIVVELWGGGGGGGLGTNTDIWGGGSAGSAGSAGSGGGGGSGGYTKATLSVMSVSACWITVGAGGIGAVSDQGGWGGNSMISCGIDSPQYADGGGGWPGSELGGGAGGAGGVGNTLAGNPGHTGYSGGFSTPGGFGGAPVTGIVPPTRSAGEGGLGGMVGFGVGHPGSDGLVVVHW